MKYTHGAGHPPWLNGHYFYLFDQKGCRPVLPELNDLRLSEPSKTETTVWHTHPFVQIGCLLRGGVGIRFAEARFELDADDCYIIAAGHLHEVVFERGCAVYHGFFSLSESPAFFTRQAVGAADGSRFRSHSLILRGRRDLRESLAVVLDSWRKGTPSGRLAAQCGLVQMLVTLDPADGDRLPVRSAAVLAEGGHQLFLRAVECIGLLYARRGLCAPDIARACHVSRTTLNTLFKRQLGYGPKEYLQRFRVDRAREDLRMDTLTLARVAERNGFADVYSFNRIFRRFAGMPPGRYRRMHCRS